MKNRISLFGFTALVAVIGFTMAACRNESEPAHAHQWGKWRVTAAATCIAKGSLTRTCSLDATHTETEEIAIHEDSHDYGDWTGTVTCTTAGEGTRVCSRSAEHIETKKLTALGHDYQNWTSTTAATCTTAGEETRVCSRNAEHTETNQLAALEHDYQNWTSTTAATCTATGVETGTCTRDQVTTTRSIAINPDAHDYREHTTTATATKPGTETGVCRHNETHTYTRNNVLVPMVFVPGGSFQMGKKLGKGDNSGDVTPVHTVTLTGFYIGKYEVTQAQWLEVMKRAINIQQELATTSKTDNGRSLDRPIYYVNWYEALVFCNKLSMREGLTPAYRISNSTNPDNWGTVPRVSDSPNRAAWNAATIVSGSKGYRLPTEAQWEYAAKGGDPTAAGWVGYTYAGSDTVGDVAWYRDNNGSSGSSTYGSKVVGTKAANRLGLYDMSGNVYEWCWDWYETYSSEAQTDPMGASSESGRRMFRGGCWNNAVETTRSARRNMYYPYSQGENYGLRIVRPAQ